MANSVLEALAFGTPVLASYIDGNRSVVKEGATGFLFRGEREFLDRARDLLRNPALGRRLGEQGRELVRERFPRSGRRRPTWSSTGGSPARERNPADDRRVFLCAEA